MMTKIGEYHLQTAVKETVQQMEKSPPPDVQGPLLQIMQIPCFLSNKKTLHILFHHLTLKQSEK